MAIPVMEFQVQGYKISKNLLNCKETLVFVLFFWIYLCRNSWVIGKQYVFDREPYAHNSTTGTTILLHTWSFFGRISFAWPGVRSHILFLNRLWDKIITVIGTYKLTTKQQITKADPAKINCSKCAREGVFNSVAVRVVNKNIKFCGTSALRHSNCHFFSVALHKMILGMVLFVLNKLQSFILKKYENTTFYY